MLTVERKASKFFGRSSAEIHVIPCESEPEPRRMQNHLPDLGQWPNLEWEQWKDTADTLHMYTQIVGKTRLALTPVQNHWWNVPLYVTARGLSTSALPTAEGQLLDVEFDFLSHEVVCRTSLGDVRKIELSARPVAEFFRGFSEALVTLGV